MIDRNTTSEEFFEALYKQKPDPWSFATDTYEQGRYRAIMDTLGEQRFRRAFEPGCSVGVLTARLAGVCDAVEAIDISATAAEAARQRCRNLTGVTIQQGSVPDDLPVGTFDLIVFSEIGYYFDPPKLTSLVKSLLARLDSGGIFLAAHWLGHSPDHKLTGDQVHALLLDQIQLAHGMPERCEHFRIDYWTNL